MGWGSGLQMTTRALKHRRRQLAFQVAAVKAKTQELLGFELGECKKCSSVKAEAHIGK